MAAALYYGRSFLEGFSLGHSCTVCRRKDAAARREEWGCDRPTDAVQVWIPCIRCGGQDEDCPACGGGGFEGIHECPRKLLGADADACELFNLHETYPAALPRAGGLHDQPARYLAAMRLIEWASRRLEADIENDAEQRRKLDRAT